VSTQWPELLIDMSTLYHFITLKANVPPGRVNNTGTRASPGRVRTTGPFAASGYIYITGA
jgi:hypothetical protein